MGLAVLGGLDESELRNGGEGPSGLGD